MESKRGDKTVLFPLSSREGHFQFTPYSGENPLVPKLMGCSSPELPHLVALIRPSLSLQFCENESQCPSLSGFCLPRSGGGF